METQKTQPGFTVQCTHKVTPRKLAEYSNRIITMKPCAQNDTAILVPRSAINDRPLPLPRTQSFAGQGPGGPDHQYGCPLTGARKGKGVPRKRRSGSGQKRHPLKLTGVFPAGVGIQAGRTDWCG
jgi:hypothetical protein